MLVDITKTVAFNVTMTKCFFCIDFGVGSKNGSDDVYPEQQVGFGEFGGGASLTSEGIKLSAKGNMTAAATVAGRETSQATSTWSRAGLALFVQLPGQQLGNTEFNSSALRLGHYNDSYDAFMITIFAVSRMAFTGNT